MSPRVVIVVGARPNFMKAAPVFRALLGRNVTARIVHTGQHYDKNMSDVFFNQLGLPQPDDHLGVGGGTHATQTAQTMIEFEKVVTADRPDIVVVVGDVNSTIACSLVAAKLQIPVAHVEAGLRSFDRSMPEEINRILTDRISDLLFVTEESGLVNLRNEGTDPNKIHFVGNVMIDSLVHVLGTMDTVNSPVQPAPRPREYVVATMHRPSNVDDPAKLSIVAEMLTGASDLLPVYIPLHPRTRKSLETNGHMAGLLAAPRVFLLEPLGYVEFLDLLRNAAVVVTDSGGIQEETTYLSVPCLTVRENTERPSTIEIGSNELVPLDPVSIKDRIRDVVEGRDRVGGIPPLWDGKAAERIADVLIHHLG